MLIGVDIGGTFTDIVVSNAGRLCLFKTASTSQDPADGVIAALSHLIQRGVIIPEQVERIAHGSTVATNALLEGKWAKTALVTTRGFRDILEIGRQNRPKLYDLFFERPLPMVSRDLRFEITERLDAKGNVIRSLAKDDVQRLLPLLREADVDAVAIVFLFSYLNPAHEQAVRDAITTTLDISVTLSSDVFPEFREFERTSTTVVSAALRPVIRDYLTLLEAGARENGLTTRWQIMQSNGTVTRTDYAQTNPARLLLSGPAAGVEGARVVGKFAGFNDLITLDMGGTSCDVSLIRNGMLSRTTTGQVGNYPVALPMIDIHTIGAGGGSIAWVDRGGALRVGPQSAGASPGPACYDHGGLEPTVTDAHLVLGHLLPSYPLGGLDHLDMTAARKAMEKVANPLGITIEEVAFGMLEIADAAMERAIRVISIERGYDPRDFSLLAFGGAGPLHAVSIARRLAIPRVIVPAVAGVLSAFGLVAAEVGHDFSQGVVRPLRECEPAVIKGILSQLCERTQAELTAEGVKKGAIRFHVSADLRYSGQAHELNVPLLDIGAKDTEPWAIDTAFINRIVSAFHTEHYRRYGHTANEEAIEMVALRVHAVGPPIKVTLTGTFRGEEEEREITRVNSWFTKEKPMETHVLHRGGLFPESDLVGPAIVFGEDATTLLPPGTSGRIDKYGNLILEIR